MILINYKAIINALRITRVYYNLIDMINFQFHFIVSFHLTFIKNFPILKLFFSLLS